MDDPERTRVWRRPPAGSGTLQRTEHERAGDRYREPVRTSDTAANVNQPGLAWAPPPPPTATQLAVWRAQRVIYYVFGVIQAFIAIRFILKMLNANPASAFTQVIYTISWVFVFPFNGVVPNTAADGYVFEWFSVIAIIIYALVSIGLAKLLALLI
jgi:hypothetical protein